MQRFEFIHDIIKRADQALEQCESSDFDMPSISVHLGFISANEPPSNGTGAIFSQREKTVSFFKSLFRRHFQHIEKLCITSKKIQSH